MTPADLHEWRTKMRISRLEACRQLGISQNYWTKMQNGVSPIPRHIALACASLIRGIKPWPE